MSYRRQRILFFRAERDAPQDRKSTRLNSSHRCTSYAVFCLKKKSHSARPISNQRRYTPLLTPPISSVSAYTTRTCPTLIMSLEYAQQAALLDHASQFADHLH